MLTKLLLGKSTKLWDLYLDQALFACRVRTHQTTKTSPFYLVYGKHPRLLGDDNVPLSTETLTADHESRIETVVTARQQAAQATYARALQAKTLRDEIVKEHELREGEWVLVRHETPQKFESKWFGPYQITQRMALGTYRLQDPSGKELQALVHGNRLLKAHINSTEALRKLWASPAAKDALRRRNNGGMVELVESDTRGTEQLDSLLLGDNTLESTISQTPIVDDIPEPESETTPTTEVVHQSPIPQAVEETPRIVKRKRKVNFNQPERKSNRTRRPVTKFNP
jgi:hypothetical protein